MNSFYLPVILWALHQLLGTQKGSDVYAQILPIITAAMSK